MSPLEGYLKYYWLEQKYLGKEVHSHFRDKGFLTAEQFFLIAEWKIPRFGKTLVSYLKDEDIKKLTERIHKTSSLKERLEIFLKDGEKNRKGIKLAMASAILTILYPDDFTVYDIRVRKQLFKDGSWPPNKNQKTLL